MQRFTIQHKCFINITWGRKYKRGISLKLDARPEKKASSKPINKYELPHTDEGIRYFLSIKIQ